MILETLMKGFDAVSKTIKKIPSILVVYFQEEKNPKKKFPAFRQFIQNFSKTVQQRQLNFCPVSFSFRTSHVDDLN